MPNRSGFKLLENLKYGSQSEKEALPFPFTSAALCILQLVTNMCTGSPIG